MRGEMLSSNKTWTIFLLVCEGKRSKLHQLKYIKWGLHKYKEQPTLASGCTRSSNSPPSQTNRPEVVYLPIETYLKTQSILGRPKLRLYISWNLQFDTLAHSNAHISWHPKFMHSDRATTWALESSAVRTISSSRGGAAKSDLSLTSPSWSKGQWKLRHKLSH